MKRRIVSLILLVCMLLPVSFLTACGKKEEDADSISEDRTFVSIDLWLPCYGGTTEESKQLVQDALNGICEEKYSTHLVLHLIDSDQYEAAIQSRYEEIETEIERLEEESRALRSRQLAGETIVTEEPAADTQEQTETDEYGISTIVYPAIGATQMDVFLARGYDHYVQYAGNNLLKDLDAALTEGDPKLLKSYIYPSFLSHSSYYGMTYGIPNNHPLNDYTYLLINKECVEKVKASGVSFDVSAVTSPYSCLDFIRAVAKTCPDVVPVNDYFDYYGVWFWNEAKDPSKFSLIASQIGLEDEETTPIVPKNVFEQDNFVYTYYMNKLIKENGWVGNGTGAPGTYAVSMVKGDADLASTYGDQYYLVPVEYPTATVEDVCENLFVVSKYTKDVSRSLEIITLINTNESFRTILQYGVEGIHWKYTDATKQTITRLSDSYVMKLAETGNLYLTYPDYGTTKDLWEFYKTQNLDSRISPHYYLDFDMKTTADGVNEAVSSAEANVSKYESTISGLEKQIANFDTKTGTAEELEALKSSLAAAQRSLASSKESLADIRKIQGFVESLKTRSSSVFDSIERMNATTFLSSVESLKNQVNGYETVLYLLCVDEYYYYLPTEDTVFQPNKIYYRSDGKGGFEEAKTTTGAAITYTVYEQYMLTGMYGLVNQYNDFWNMNYGSDGAV